MKILTKLLKEKFKLEKLDEILKVVMDSRKIEKDSLFFAINNGNKYIDEVLERGATLVIADDYSGDDSRVIVVEDTIKAMQDLAQEYRKALGVKVIAITGSNGKTTTKDMIYSVLSQKYRCKKTEGNYNNHIGLPFTILQLDDTDEVSVLEMGMSGFGEIDRLCEIAKPDYALITNIGDSHLEFLKTRENVFKAKGEIIKYVVSENLIIFGDDYYLKNLSGITVGYEKNCKKRIENFKDTDEGIEFSLEGNNYKINLNGKHNCINGAMAVVVGMSLDLTSEEIQKGFDNLNLTPMRFQKIVKGETLYINDAYNASPISMRYSLETFDKLYNDRTKIAVLGDMLELGDKEIEFHREIIKKALDIKVDRIYIYGERMQKAYELMKQNKKIITSLDKNFIRESIKESIKGSKAILLKGSRGMKMEEIIEG